MGEKLSPDSKETVSDKTELPDFHAENCSFAVKCITEKCAQWIDTNGVRRKRLTLYIMAEDQSEETKSRREIFRLFVFAGAGKTQYPVVNQKAPAFFSLFLREKEVVRGRKLCYNDCN